LSDYTGCTRIVATSAVNTLNTVTTTVGKAYRLRMVTVTYSGTSTATPTVTLVSGAGAGYNVILNSITLAANQGVYIPTTPVPVNADDQISVAAPGVASVTSSVTIYVDRLAG